MKKHPINSPTAFSRYVLFFRYAAISAILIFAVYIGFNYYLSLNYKDIPLALKLVKGNIQINDKTAGSFTIIKSGNIIQTQNDSYADLYYDNIFSLRLAAETTVEIKKCLVNDKDPAYRLEFDIKNGAIYANFFRNIKKEYKLEYIFNTPAAVISSIGTEFLLKASNDNTMLIMREGEVKIKSIESGNQITAKQGKKYFIGSDFKTNNIDDYDKSYIDSILNSGIGANKTDLRK